MSRKKHLEAVTVGLSQETSILVPGLAKINQATQESASHGFSFSSYSE